MTDWGFLLVLLCLATIGASVLVVLTGRRLKASHRELAAVKKEAADLRKVLSAFRIDPNKSCEMVDSPSEVWLGRAGLFGAALIQAYWKLPPGEQNPQETPLMEEWLWSLPGYTEHELDSAKEHQEHVAEKWLLPLIKSE